MRACVSAPWVAALAWTAYAFVPVTGWGWLPGRPLGPTGTLVVLAVAWVWIFHRRIPFPRLVVAALVVKTVAGGGLPLEHGFAASYFANDGWRPPHERSIDFITRPVTRVDDRLEFRERSAPLPLHFVNDATRFNFFQPGEPDRGRLPVSVGWRGWLHAAGERVERFYLAFPPPDLRDFPARWTREYTADFLFWLDWFAPRLEPDVPGIQALYQRVTSLAARKDDPHNAGKDVSGRRVVMSWPSLPDTPGAPPPVRAALAVDGRTVLRLDGAAARGEREVALAGGWHELVVLYAAGQDVPRRFAAGTVRQGHDHPLGAGDVYVAPAPPWRLPVDRIVRAAAVALDAIVITLLAGWVALRLAAALGRLGRALVARTAASAGRDAVAVAAAAVVVVIAVRALPLVGVPIILNGGDDQLTYASYARDIALNGPLMLLGAAVGGAQPFYYQPLYPYFLAVVHLLVGEDFWGVYVVQQLLLAGMVWALGRLTALLFGHVAGWLALAVGWYFGYCVMTLNAAPQQISASLLGESLFAPLLVFWTLAVTALARSPGGAVARAAATGVLGGIAVLTRTPLLLAVPPVAAILGWSLWRRRRRAALTPVAVFVTCLGLTVGLATLRNGVASGQWALAATSGPVNLLISNPPPPHVDVSRAQTRPLYASFGLHPQVRTVVEYAIQAPASFAHGLVGKASYTLGLSESGREPRALMLIWASALLGFGMALQPGLSGPERFAPALVALCHFAVMVIVGVFAYGYRLTYPMYVMLLPYSALALATIGSKVRTVATQSGRSGRTPAPPP
ncbi:MAG: glycosyltransferase family 39 protein [Candidatus Rokubacteria bacterium]|nr:glycosyltransferase family 39 protein [Candidatus Rokubacteria bacterium]